LDASIDGKTTLPSSQYADASHLAGSPDGATGGIAYVAIQQNYKRCQTASVLLDRQEAEKLKPLPTLNGVAGFACSPDIATNALLVKIQNERKRRTATKNRPYLCIDRCSLK